MINIYTFQFNNPQFLEWQFKTFKHFLKEEHQLICINNSFDKPAEKEAIRAKAEELGIPHYIPENMDARSGGYGHQSALNDVWQKFVVPSNDINIFIDHDMFLIRELLIDLNYDIIGVAQGRGEHIKYLHPGFIIFNNTLKDKETICFKGEKIDEHWCDSGGNFWNYWREHPDIKVKGLSLVNISPDHENLDVLPPEARVDYTDSDPIQILENYVLHVRNGSNWAWTEQSTFNRKLQQAEQTINYYMSL